MLFNFTLKTDDDCFVNVEKILKVSFTAILFCLFVWLILEWTGSQVNFSPTSRRGCLDNWNRRGMKIVGDGNVEPVTASLPGPFARKFRAAFLRRKTWERGWSLVISLEIWNSSYLWLKVLQEQLPCFLLTETLMTPIVEILRLWAPFVFLEVVNQTQKSTNLGYTLLFLKWKICLWLIFSE